MSGLDLALTYQLSVGIIEKVPVLRRELWLTKLFSRRFPSVKLSTSCLPHHGALYTLRLMFALFMYGLLRRLGPSKMQNAISRRFVTKTASHDMAKSLASLVQWLLPSTWQGQQCTSSCGWAMTNWSVVRERPVDCGSAASISFVCRGHSN